MALQTITIDKLGLRNEAVAITSTLLTDATNGCKFLMDMEDNRCVILLDNSDTSEQSVAIKKGNGYAGVVDNTITIPASTKMFCTIDSSYYKNVSGDDKGYVFIIPSVASKIKVSVLNLPI